MSGRICPDCGLLYSAGGHAHVCPVQRWKPPVLAADAPLNDAQIQAVCIEYVRVRNLQTGDDHGPPALHSGMAECFDAWRLAFASVGAKL